MGRRRGDGGGGGREGGRAEGRNNNKIETRWNFDWIYLGWSLPRAPWWAQVEPGMRG